MRNCPASGDAATRTDSLPRQKQHRRCIMKPFRTSGIAASPHYLIRSFSCVLRMDLRLAERRFASADSDTGSRCVS